eukprot:TRINITY_DN3024_c0_g2_i1.p1 TRINITY_DN3024_c0_g2~~TRINITY_DN3024_c0_g2_i1.p1  ORF type:complete len:254 (-),score=22.58 TRINITY_DN3024_c0_g2_i1:54-815(-)
MLNKQKPTKKNQQQLMFHQNFPFSLPESNADEVTRTTRDLTENLIEIWKRVGGVSFDEEERKFFVVSVLKTTKLTLKTIKNTHAARYGRKKSVPVLPRVFRTFFKSLADSSELEQSVIKIRTLVRLAQFFGKSGVARGFSTGDRAIVGPKALMNVMNSRGVVIQRIVVLPLMFTNDVECVAYTFHNERRCNLLGLEVKGVMMRVKRDDLSDWRCIEVEQKGNHLHVNSFFWVWNSSGDLQTERIEPIQIKSVN